MNVKVHRTHRRHGILRGERATVRNEKRKRYHERPLRGAGTELHEEGRARRARHSRRNKTASLCTHVKLAVDCVFREENGGKGGGKQGGGETKKQRIIYKRCCIQRKVRRREGVLIARHSGGETQWETHGQLRT